LAGIIALAGRIALQFYQRFILLQLGGLIFLSMWYVINKLLHVKRKPDIVFIHLFLIPYRAHSFEDWLVRDMVLKTRE